MDSAVSGHKSEDEDEKRDKAVNLEARSVLDGIKVEINGETSHEVAAVVSPATAANREVAKVEKGGDLSSATPPSTGGTKGKGLRKWRRIRRETSKEGTVGIDAGRILKRGLSTPESVKPGGDEKPKGDDVEAESSVASADFRKLELPVGVLGPELEMLVTETGFSLGYDSENSEDRSSKSSTAASGLRQRFEFGRERSRGKGSMGRGPGVVVQHKGMRGRGGVDDSIKKSREDRFTQGRDVSRSSVESDVRSSNAMLLQAGSTSSNGRQSRGSVNYDGKGPRGRSEDDLEDGFYKENGEDNDEAVISELKDDASHENEVRREEDESFQSNNDPDPFIEPISLLQAAQEALEREVQMFEEIESNFYFDETEGVSSPSLQSYLQPTGSPEHAESESQEASTPAEGTQPKDLDCHSTLSGTQEPTKDSKGVVPPHLQYEYKNMELELENILKNKLELEIECMTLRKTVQLWKVALEDQVALSEEQKSLMTDYEDLVTRLSDSESRVAALKSQAEELEASCEELVGKDEVLTLQNSALCLLVQLAVLVVAFWFLVLHLIPASDDYVPT